MLMANRAKETPEAVRGGTWHRAALTGSGRRARIRARRKGTVAQARRLRQVRVAQAPGYFVVRLRRWAAPTGAAQAASCFDRCGSGSELLRPVRRRCRAGMQGRGGGSRLWGSSGEGVNGME